MRVYLEKNVQQKRIWVIKLGTKFKIERNVDEKTFWFITLRVKKIIEAETFIFSTSKDDYFRQSAEIFSQAKPNRSVTSTELAFYLGIKKKEMIVDNRVLEEQNQTADLNG